MLILVLNMTTKSEAGHPVDVFSKAFMPTGGNPDGFKGLRLDCNAIQDD